MSKISVLGTDYEILIQNEKENPKLKNANGLCEIFAQKVIIENPKERNDECAYENVNAYWHKVLRHEFFHAIFAEAGLTDYLEDETLVDVLAVLYPKIKKIMEQADDFDFTPYLDRGDEDGKSKNQTNKRQGRARKMDNGKR